MNPQITERHPFEPFLPANARLWMLGSFPPQRERWAMDFYYPNLQNDMWRIFGLIFFSDKNYFLSENRKMFCKDRLTAFLEEKGVALYDTGCEIIRQKGNASDKFLEIVTPLNPEKMLSRLPLCRALATTGEKATETLLPLLPGATAPKVGQYTEFTLSGRQLRLYRMPSSSRAYPKPVEEKAAIYRKMFEELDML